MAHSFICFQFYKQTIGKLPKITHCFKLLTMSYMMFSQIEYAKFSFSKLTWHLTWKQIVFHYMIENGLTLYYLSGSWNHLWNVWGVGICCSHCCIWPFLMNFCLEILKFQKILRSTLFTFICSFYTWGS